MVIIGGNVEIVSTLERLFADILSHFIRRLECDLGAHFRRLCLLVKSVKHK